jgi:hypothetical protein
MPGALVWLFRDTTQALKGGSVSLKRRSRIRKLKRMITVTACGGFYATSLSEVLHGVLGDLEQKPPKVERALARIRQLVDGERPAA